MRFLLILLTTWSLFVKASQEQTYGLGGASSGRVSSVTAETENPFAALYNPALISAQASSLFAFTTGGIAARTGTLSSVLVDSPQYRTERGVSRTQDFRLPDQTAALWSAGLTLPFSLPPTFGRRAGFGLTLSGPYQRLRSFTSLTPYDFSLLRYGTSDTQFKGTLGLSVELWPRYLYIGGGMTLFLTSAGSADSTLVSENPTGRFALDIGFNTAAVAGLFARYEQTSVALVFRQEINPTFEQRFEGKVQIGGTDTLVQPFVMKTSLYYEPSTLELETQHDFGMVKTSLGVSYQMWDGYQPSYLVVSATDARGETRATQAPAFQLRSTLNPRASIEVPFFNRKLFLCAGYQYRPTPVGDLSGAANILDSNTHVAGLSISHRLKANAFLPVPLTWGVYGQYHWFVTRAIEKSSAQFIGAPRFNFSGSAYTYGFALQAEL